MRSVVDDIGVDAVKTGMLGTATTTLSVASLLADLPATVPVVVDPVCASKHGDPLIDTDAIEALRGDLLRTATVITPNLPEAALLAGRDGTPVELAEILLSYGPAWVLVKGGHAEGAPTDRLFGADGTVREFTAERVGQPAQPRHRLHPGVGDRQPTRPRRRRGDRRRRGEGVHHRRRRRRLPARRRHRPHRPPLAPAPPSVSHL